MLPPLLPGSGLTDPFSQAENPVNKRSRLLLLLVYGGTGITALSYEILWTRMISLLFGISIFGVVLTVTAFMAGLGAGSLAGARRQDGQGAAQALRLLAVLEAGIAIYALALPFIMPWLDSFLLALGGGLSIRMWQGMQGIALMLLLFPAAMAMGYAFPLALRAARTVGVSLGGMYGINALGGAAGAILPLLLLPAFGWRSALLCVAALGFLFAGLAWVLSRQLFSANVPADESLDLLKVSHPPLLDLMAYAGIGAAALILEVVWSRLYGMVLLRTEYVLGVLLLVFLAGIGLGSVLARRLRMAGHVARWLNVLPVCAALLAIAGQYALPNISQWANRTEFDSLLHGMLMQGGAVMLLTLPVTLALGAWLPLLARHFSTSENNSEDTSSGAWWYGANSLGAALGALLAGFILLPWLGATASLGTGAMLLLLCGMRWVEDRRYWLALPLALLLFWPVRHMPPVASLLPALPNVHDLTLYEDAVALTQVVEQASGQRLLLSDLQRMDASSDPTAVTVQKNQARLPLLLHPGARSILFLGLGTGVTASGSLPFGGLQRTAVELSAGAIAAAHDSFSLVNGGVVNKLRVLRDDARRFLRTDKAQYDVIVGDLFHPDMVGRANLLSVQQFRRARARLAPKGVFVQWVALNQFNVPMLKVVLQSFRNAFSGSDNQALLFVDGYRAALIGVKEGDIQSANLLRCWQQMQPDAASKATGGEGLWTWLGRYWGKIPELSGDIPVQDEWAPVIEFALPRVHYAGGANPFAMWRWMLSWREDAKQAAAALHVAPEDFTTFKRAWAASAIDVRMWQAELVGDDAKSVEWAKLAHRANDSDRWPAFALADRMFASLESGDPRGLSKRQALGRILALRPDHEDALRAMLHLELHEGQQAAADMWRQRLAVVSPLAFDVRQE